MFSLWALCSLWLTFFCVPELGLGCDLPVCVITVKQPFQFLNVMGFRIDYFPQKIKGFIILYKMAQHFVKYDFVLFKFNGQYEQIF